MKSNDFSPNGPRSILGDQKLSSVVKSTEANPISKTVTSFDAAIDSRPVWAVKEEKLRSSTEGFRNIPIEKSIDDPVLGAFGCDNIGNNTDVDSSIWHKSSLKPLDYRKDSMKINKDEMFGGNHTFENDYAESPVLDLSSPPSIFTNRSPLLKNPQRIHQRAEHLRDWFCKLSPQFRMNSNPFFSSGEKPDITYPHPRYLSSPVPTFRSRSDRSPSSSIGTSNDGSILTPTDQSMLENPLHASTRRDSSGALQSPGPVNIFSISHFISILLNKQDGVELCQTQFNLAKPLAIGKPARLCQDGELKFSCL